MILTVQSTGKKNFRLGISFYDSLKTFNSDRGISVRLIISGLILNLRTNCGPPLNKGFDLYSKELSDWIVANNYNDYSYRNPTKLNFKYARFRGVHTLTFIGLV